VGQADSALIQNKNGTVMIDTGYRDSGAYLGNVLKECGNKISCLILTHPHGDHIGGTLYVLEHCEVELVILPTQPGEDARYAAILEEIAEQNIPTRTLSPGEGFSLGRARFTFLALVAILGIAILVMGLNWSLFVLAVFTAYILVNVISAVFHK
jgi:competence protein ComEC